MATLTPRRSPRLAINDPQSSVAVISRVTTPVRDRLRKRLVGNSSYLEDAKRFIDEQEKYSSFFFQTLYHGQSVFFLKLRCFLLSQWHAYSRFNTIFQEGVLNSTIIYLLIVYPLASDR